jgi:hypothetical protein
VFAVITSDSNISDMGKHMVIYITLQGKAIMFFRKDGVNEQTIYADRINSNASGGLALSVQWIVCSQVSSGSMTGQAESLA